MNAADQTSNRQWKLSSNGKMIDPTEYPYLIEWVDSAKHWAETYGIKEFIPANNEGFDPTGRVTDESESTTDPESIYPTPANLVWSSTGISEYLIRNDLCFGNMVFGWYLGQVSNRDSDVYIDSKKHVCKICRGTGYVLIPENFPMQERDPESKFEIQEDQDGLHFIPLEGYSRHEDEWEIEFECSQHICNDSWIFLEDTDFKFVD